MRLFVLALVLFMLNLSIVTVDVLGIYNFGIATSDQWINEVQAAKNDKYDPDLSADVSTSFGFGDFIFGFKLGINMLFRVIFVGQTLELFGLNPLLANLFSLAATIIYILGLAQLISNRAVKGMA